MLYTRIPPHRGLRNAFVLDGSSVGNIQSSNGKEYIDEMTDVMHFTGFHLKIVRYFWRHNTAVAKGGLIWVIGMFDHACDK